MNNRSLTLLITASLGLASLSGAFAQTTQTLPANSQSATDPQLAAAKVSLEIGTYNGPLSSLLAAVAKSAGYDVIFETNVDALAGAPSAASATPAAAPAGAAGPVSGTAAASSSARPVVYNFRNAPFNQVWPVLMDVYGLTYKVASFGTTPIIRVGVSPVQQIIKLPDNLDVIKVTDQLRRAFGSVVRTSQTVSNSNNQNASASGAASSAGTTNSVQSGEEVVLDSPTLKIVAEPTSNSVIVRGTNSEVLQVQNLAASIIASQPAALASTVPVPTVQRIYSVKGQQADAVALLAAQYPTLKVTAVGQTGQLVITGAQTQLDAALSLLASVDRATPVAPVAGTVQKVIALTNAAAKDVKAVLEGTLQRELTTTGLVGNAVPLIQADGTTVIQPPTTASSASGAALNTAPQASAQQATIIADERTNTLIVRGTQAQVDQIGQIIPSLDVRVPQVNLQVRIQEINETASRSLGVDWKAGFGNFVVNVASTAVKAIFDPTQALVGFNLGATLNALETQNMTKRVYDGAVTMQSGQRSLGATSAVSNSSSGAAAHVQSGGRIELNIPSGAANVPPIQRQIDYGVTLDFYSPQVAPDGTITVRVAGKVTGEPGDVTNGQVIRFTNSEAQTTITFKAGETVLLSGLLGTDQGSTSGGIPFLSSIPVIGSLFGTQTSRNTRSQLLVVITGNVLQ